MLGFGVAALVAMTGVGGGSLMAPALILWAGITPPVAVGTDLIYAAVTKAGALWVYGRQGRVRWRLAALMLAGSLPTAVLTSLLLWRISTNLPETDRIVSLSLGVSLLLSALAIGLNGRLRAFTIARADRHVHLETIAHWMLNNRNALAVTIGALVGGLVTLSSVGAGAIGVAALMLLFPSIPPAEIIGTDMAYGVLLAATAGTGHFMMHNVNFELLLNLLIGMIPGVYVGGLFSGFLPETALRRLISVTLLGVAVRLIVV